MEDEWRIDGDLIIGAPVVTHLIIEPYFWLALVL